MSSSSYSPYDVAVIGGGPAGSQVAYRLAGMGYRVVVLEQKESLGESVCCTGIISQECVSEFSIDESVIFRRVNSAMVFSPSGKVISLWRQEPQACVVNRAAFNIALARRAQAKGAEYRLNHSVKDIELKDDAVSIKVAQQGELDVLETRAVAVATGFGSKLYESVGLKKIGDFVMGAQSEVVTTDIDEVEIYLGQEVAPGFFAWLVPTLPGRALAGLLSRRSPGLYLKKLLSSLAAQGKIASTETEISYGGIPLMPLAKTYSDRLLVVGTAAGQTKPTTGGGIYYGLLCADIAASNLAKALSNDDLTARHLANYEREWKRKLRPELRVGYWARRFYELLNDAQLDRIFDIMQSNNMVEPLLEAKDLSFDWHSSAVLKLLGQHAFSRIIKTMGLPSIPKTKVRGKIETS